MRNFHVRTGRYTILTNNKYNIELPRFLFFFSFFQNNLENQLKQHFIVMRTIQNFQKTAILFFAKFLKITALLHFFSIVRQIYKNKSNFITQYEIVFSCSTLKILAYIGIGNNLKHFQMQFHTSFWTIRCEILTMDG